jgi:NAD(P)-dependent dehydrogenase (short-subunit alcohol dehydrogenase family)
LPKYEQRAAKPISSRPIFATLRAPVRSPERPSSWAGGHVDILINNAGIYPFGPTHEMSEESFDDVYALNVKAPYFLVAELAPLMAQRGKGAIVNVSTMVADYGGAGLSLYGSSKAAINLLTKAWAAEYGPKGVRVNTVDCRGDRVSCDRSRQFRAGCASARRWRQNRRVDFGARGISVRSRRADQARLMSATRYLYGSPLSTATRRRPSHTSRSRLPLSVLACRTAS